MSSNTPASFADLGLSAPILEALSKLGYESPTPIQSESIPHLLQGRDILGQAQTGTGKTGAFALPLLQNVNTKSPLPQVLVLAPTRELAIQVAEAFGSYAQFMDGFHVLPIYGGQDITRQLRLLKRKPQVIVGTPGRVMDHMRRGTLSLDGLSALVLDEADEMLKMGFIEDIEWILEHTPESRQLALFSATMPEAIRRVANNHLQNPEHIRIKSKTSTVEAIEQCFIQTHYAAKLEVLSRVLEVEDIDGSLIFARTRNATVELAQKLEARGYRAAALNGDMNQGARERTIDGLKKGHLDIIVATDVAARGIDVNRISHVFNYDIPYDTEAYVHRIGRTGRAGRKGKAVLFVTGREMRMLRIIEKATQSRIARMDVPSAQTVGEQRLNRLANQLASTISGESLDFMRGGVAKLCQTLEIDAETLAAALLHRVQKKRPLQPAELDIRPPKRERAPRDGDMPPKRRADGSIRPAPKDLGQAGDLRDMPEVKLRRYRVDVGFAHGVKAGNIVGAIANEAGLDSQYIGEVKIYDDIATIDLPDGMPKNIFTHLKDVRVCGQALNIEEASAPRRVAKSHGPQRPERGGPRVERGGARAERGTRHERGGQRRDRGARGDRHTSGERGPRRDRSSRIDRDGPRRDRNSRIDRDGPRAERPSRRPEEGQERGYAKRGPRSGPKRDASGGGFRKQGGKKFAGKPGGKPQRKRFGKGGGRNKG